MFISMGSFELYPLRIFSILGFFCLIFFRKKSFDPLIRSFTAYNNFFLIIGLTSILWSPDQNSAIREAGILFTGIVFILLVIRNINSISRLKILIVIWIFGSIFVNFLGLFEVITHHYILQVGYGLDAADERLANQIGFLVPRSIFSNQNNYAYFNSVTCLICFGLLLRPFRPRSMYLANIIAFVMSFLLLTFSYSRAGVGGFFGGITIFFILAFKSKLKVKKYLYRSLILFSLILFIIIIYDLEFWNSILQKINLVNSKEAITNNSVRADYYVTSIEYSLNHFLIGMGPGSSVSVLNNASPHNHLLQLLVEYGIVVLAGLLWFLYWAIKRMHKYGVILGNWLPTMVVATIFVFPFQGLGPSSIIGEGIYWLWLGFVISLSSVLFKEARKVKIN